jgi:hypothetical protein
MFVGGSVYSTKFCAMVPNFLSAEIHVALLGSGFLGWLLQCLILAESNPGERVVFGIFRICVSLHLFS